MDRFGSRKNSVIIKKSPVVIAKSFIVLEFTAAVLYILASYLAYYARIYRSLSISKIIPFEAAHLMLIFAIEAVIVFYLFFEWYKEHFKIEANKITHERGILYRHKTVIFLDNVSAISYKQGLLGRLVKYGRIEFTDNSTGKITRLDNIPEPQDFIDTVLKYKHSKNNNFNNNRGQKPDILGLISAGEHEGVEFKSTFRWDTRNNKVNRELEKAAMKTITAFLNSSGGHLVIGVSDSKSVLGFGPDYATLAKQSADDFENHFSHVFSNMIGPEFRQFVHLTWHNLDGKECCVVNIEPSHRPAYLKSDGNEEFYIRTGNGTTSLKFSEASSYIESRFTLDEA